MTKKPKRRGQVNGVTKIDVAWARKAEAASVVATDPLRGQRPASRATPTPANGAATSATNGNLKVTASAEAVAFSSSGSFDLGKARLRFYDGDETIVGGLRIER